MSNKKSWFFVALILIALTIGSFVSHQSAIDLVLTCLIGCAFAIIEQLNQVQDSLKRIEGKLNRETK